MRIDVVTIFPDYLAPLELSLVGKAQRNGIIDVHVHDLREWTTDRHRTVDDTPVGGGAGMVMKPDVWGNALDELRGENAHLIIPTPSGEVFSQRAAEQLATDSHLVFACGRYEGIDARVAEYARQIGYRVSEYSLGDYVLNGGEVAALAMIEAVVRLIPGVVGNPESLIEESHSTDDDVTAGIGTGGLLEYPVYTRPVDWEGMAIPDVLLSGHHAKIARWRRDQALAKTAAVRPDLLAQFKAENLSRHDRETLRDLGWQTTPTGLRPNEDNGLIE